MNKIKVLFFFFLIFSIQTLSADSQLYIDHVVIQGNKSFTVKRVLDVLRIPEKQSYSSLEIKNKVRDLEFFYRQEGYTICTVDSYVDLNNNLIVKIREGMVQDLIFLDLSYLQSILAREEFGDYTEQIFHKPSVEKKLEKIATIARTSNFYFDFLPVENRDGYYYLFVSKKAFREIPANFSKKDAAAVQKKAQETAPVILEPYSELYFNFRGWFLSLVPYFFMTFYNLGGIDHSLRLGIDIRFSTLEWLYLKFKESIAAEYYTLNYFSPPVYKNLRLNFYSGVFTYLAGRADLGVSNYRIIYYPFELGLGFDFKYYWASLRAGVTYEKVRNLLYDIDNFDSNKYPEMAGESDRFFNSIDLNFSHTDNSLKKYAIGRNDFNSFSLNYSFNKDFSWFTGSANYQKFFYFQDSDMLLFKINAFTMIGKFPVYHQIASPIRGYLLNTDRSLFTGFEFWNSIYKEYIHMITFIEGSWFNNQTFTGELAMGDYALSYGLGVSFSYYEFNFRIYYAVPIKQRLNEGTFDFFLDKRF